MFKRLCYRRPCPAIAGIALRQAPRTNMDSRTRARWNHPRRRSPHAAATITRRALAESTPTHDRPIPPAGTLPIDTGINRPSRSGTAPTSPCPRESTALDAVHPATAQPRPRARGSRSIPPSNTRYNCRTIPVRRGSTQSVDLRDTTAADRPAPAGTNFRFMQPAFPGFPPVPPGKRNQPAAQCRIRIPAPARTGINQTKAQGDHRH